MSSPRSLRLALGEFDAPTEARMSSWAADAFCSRLWDHDHTLWSADPQPEITDRLDWLDLPVTMTGEIADFTELGAELRSDGITRVVLMGMGGSSLAPEVLAATFPTDTELVVLDSTHPEAVAAVAADSRDSVFVVASKSGTTIEPLSFLAYFWDKSNQRGDRFIAITDPGTPLADLARERQFRRLFEASPNVGGRYSALTAFGLVPAALAGVPVAEILEAAGRLRLQSMACDSDNEALRLGAALAVLADAGRDKATFFCSPAISRFPSWVEQLIAESTGKGGIGIVPIADEAIGPPHAYGSDRAFVYLAVTDDDDHTQAAAVTALEDAGHPVIRMDLDSPSELGAEMYRAEYAVAAAGSALGIHPFNQPDVQAAKELARQAMSGADLGEVESLPASQAAHAIGDLADQMSPGDYLGLLAFIHADPAAMSLLSSVRHSLRDRTGNATTLGFGPRYLHSTGQLHKGGPNTGAFVQFVDTPAEDIDVPGESYSFGDLIAAQADGDYAALKAAGRRVVRIDLGTETRSGLEEVLAGLDPS